MFKRLRNNINWWKNGFQDKAFTKRFLIIILGFGIAGILWGLECFNNVVGSSKSFSNPFYFILGAVFFGVIGGLSLALIRTEDIKQVIKIIVLGALGCFIAFLIPGALSYWLYLLGGLISPLIIFLSLVISKIFGISEDLILDEFLLLTNLKSTLMIFTLWLEFFFTGAIIGLAYALIFKIKILSTITRTAICFALVSLIAPILGNLIGVWLFNSLFLAYMITFGIIGIGLGVPLFKLLEKQNN